MVPSEKNMGLQVDFLPMVPGGGTVGLQMDFFSFFSPFFFIVSTPLTFGCKETFVDSKGGNGGRWVGGEGGGVGMEG